MSKNFSAIITANISKFKAKMQEVNNIIKRTADDVTIDVEARISKAEANLKRLQAKIKTMTSKDAVKHIDADITEYKRKMLLIKSLDQTLKVVRTVKIKADTDHYDRAMKRIGAMKLVNKDMTFKIKASTAEAQSKIDKLNASMRKVKNKIRVKVDAATAVASAKITKLKAKLKTLPHKVHIFVELNDNFNRRLDSIASYIRTLNVIFGSMLKGALVSMIPAISSVGATAVGALGTIGVAAGVTTGALAGLAGGFGLLGTALGTFAYIAARDMKAAQKEVSGELPTNFINGVAKKWNEESTKLGYAMEDFRASVRSNVFETFYNMANLGNKALDRLYPAFTSVFKAVSNLSSSLNKSFDTAPVQKFIDYLNKDGQTVVERMGRGVGFFGRSMVSLATAFAPLTNSMSQGFLDMSKRVDEWSAKLVDSPGMKTFTEYVNANIPKLRTGFRDMGVGIANTFAAFAPLAQDAMTWFQNLMARFREWSSQLAQSEGFKQFVQYIYEVAPKVGQLISNLSQLFTNLAIGLAPLGSAILDVANKFLTWINSMMQTHPQIGQLIAKVISFIGVAMAIGPALIAVGGAFLDIVGKIASSKLSAEALKGCFEGLKAVFSSVGIGIMVFIGMLVYLYNTNETTRGLINSAWQSIQGIISGVVGIVGDILTNLIGIVKWLADAFAPLINAVLLAGATFLNWISSLLQSDSWLRKIIVAIGTAVGIFMVISGVVSVATTVWGGLVAVWGVVTGVVSFLTGAFGLLTTAVGMASLPVVAIVAAIAAVIAIVVLLYNKCEWFRNAVNAVWEFIKNIFSSAAKWIGDKLSGIGDSIHSLGEKLGLLGPKSQEATSKVSESTALMKTNVTQHTAEMSNQSQFNAQSMFDKFSLGFPQMNTNAVTNSALMKQGVNTNTSAMALNSNTDVQQMMAQYGLNFNQMNLDATTQTSAMQQSVNMNTSTLATNGTTDIQQFAQQAGVNFSQMNLDAVSQTASMQQGVNANTAGLQVQSTTDIQSLLAQGSPIFGQLTAEATAQTSALQTGVNANTAAMGQQAVSDIQNMSSQTTQAFSQMVSSCNNALQGLSSNMSQSFSRIASGTNQVMSAMSSMIVSRFNQIQSTTTSAVSKMTSVMTQGFTTMNKVAVSSMNSMASAMQSAGSRITSIASNTAQSVVRAMQSAQPGMVSAGSYAMQGFAAGMQSQSGHVMSVASSIANAAAQTIRNALQVRSPSRVMKKVGHWVSVGLANGIEKSGKFVEKASSSVSDIVKDTIQPELNSAIKLNDLKADVRAMEIKQSSSINKNIEGTIDINNKEQSANILLRLGDSEFETFVDNIYRVAQQRQQLRERFN